MPRFECLNKECGEQGKEVFFSKINYRFDKVKGTLIANEDINCKVCGRELSPVKTNGFPQLLKHNSLSMEEKKKVIHNRAQNHFEKVGREQKNSIKKETIKRYMSK